MRLMQDEGLIHEVAGGASVAHRKGLITAAKSFAARWCGQPHPVRRAVLHALIQRVVIHSDKVVLTVRLGAIPLVVVSDLEIRRLPPAVDGPTRTLSVPARIKRMGMQTKLLVQGPEAPVRRQADRSLIRLIGQAHHCRHILDCATDNQTMTALAAKAGVSATYFTRVVRLSFLAPEITNMILKGRQPQELTAHMLITLGPPPASWEEQKRRWVSPEN